MHGYNTDWSAAISAVEAGLSGNASTPGAGPSKLAGLVCVVLGTGGAARALAFGAAQRGASVVIAGRCVPVLFLKPKYQLGHPENYFFLLSKKIFLGAKYPKNILCNCDNESTGVCVP